MIFLMKLKIKEIFKNKRIIVGLILVFSIGLIVILAITKQETIKEQYNKLFHKPTATVNINSIRNENEIAKNIDMKIVKRETNLKKGLDVVYVKYKFNSNLMSIDGTVAYYYKYDFLYGEWECIKEKQQKDFQLDYDISGDWEGTNEDGQIINVSFGPMNELNNFKGIAQVDDDDEVKFTGVSKDWWNNFELMGFHYYKMGSPQIIIPYDKEADYLGFGLIDEDFKLTRKLTSEQDNSDSVLGTWTGIVQSDNHYEGIRFDFETIEDSNIQGTMTAVSGTSENLDFSNGETKPINAEYDSENNDIIFYSPDGIQVTISIIEENKAIFISDMMSNFYLIRD